MSSIEFCKVDSIKIEVQINSNNHPKSGCIIFAPYPKMGGTMSFPMLREIFYDFNNKFDLICRFNYRGVGKSTASFLTDNDGYFDGKAVQNYLTEKFPSLSTFILIGYSYGSAVAAKLACEIPQIRQYIGISPPFTMFPKLFQPMLSSERHSIKKLFIIGTEDQFTSLKEYNEYQSKISNSQFQQIQKMDHFWGQTEKLKQLIHNFLQE